MSTAFLGPRGTFSEEAAIAYAGANAELMPFASIAAAASAAETGITTDAVLPIENSLEGQVSATLDLLIHQTPLKIKAELVVPVSLCLIVAPGASLQEITVVTSHPNPFGQSRGFLEKFLPKAEQVAALSTAAAVEDVLRSGDRHRAAIGTARSAELFGGQILARDIQDWRGNVTRFVVLAHEDAAPTGDDKTSIAFTIPEDVPGSLHAVMSPMAKVKLQLTKIESRPSKLRLGHYVFLIDLLGHRLDPKVATALEETAVMCDTFKIFGSYPRFPLEKLQYLLSGNADR